MWHYTYSGVGGADFRPPRVWKLTIPFGRSRDDDDRDEPGLAAPCRHTHEHSDTCVRHDVFITLRIFQLNCIQYYLNEESARKNANTPRCVQKGGAQNFHLQLIKFWWSCAPVKRVCGGAKVFWLRLATANAVRALFSFIYKTSFGVIWSVIIIAIYS